jgi:hypothetical protein
VLNLHFARPFTVVETPSVLQEVLPGVDVDGEVAGVGEELRCAFRQSGPRVTAGLRVADGLVAEVVEERDAVVVADVEEEVDEVGVVLEAPSGNLRVSR